MGPASSTEGRADSSCVGERVCAAVRVVLLIVTGISPFHFVARVGVSAATLHRGSRTMQWRYTKLTKRMKMCIFAAVVAALEDRYRASQGATPAFPTGLPLGRVCADTCVGVAALVCVCLYVCLSCLYVHARVCARIVCNTQARERICCQRLRHQCRGQLWCGGGTTRSLALWTFLPMSCERRLSVDQ